MTTTTTTTTTLAPNTIADHFIAACHGELSALKPGNVHIYAPGHRMDVSHFEASAKAAAPHIADTSLSVGQRISRAVTASFDTAGCNTNLGIILLCVPLAVAAQATKHFQKPDLRRSLANVLANLSVQDATYAFEAIAYANPAGLGDAPDEDVHTPPTRTLREAMALASSRDRISKAFVSDYADIFETGLPVLHAASDICTRDKFDQAFATTTLHMTYLANFPDSHIERKHGPQKARLVQDAARERKLLWTPTARLETFQELMAFDTWLKDQNLNPGTTADLVVATLFADLLATQSK